MLLGDIAFHGYDWNVLPCGDGTAVVTRFPVAPWWHCEKWSLQTRLFSRIKAMLRVFSHWSHLKYKCGLAFALWYWFVCHITLPAPCLVCTPLLINNTMVGKYICFGYLHEGPGLQNKVITAAHMHTVHVSMLATAFRCIIQYYNYIIVFADSWRGNILLGTASSLSWDVIYIYIYIYIYSVRY